MTGFTFRHVKNGLDELEAAMRDLEIERNRAIGERDRSYSARETERAEAAEALTDMTEQRDKFMQAGNVVNALAVERLRGVEQLQKELAQVIENGRAADLRQVKEREEWLQKIEQLKAESASYFKQIERLVAEKNDLKRELACHRIGACVKNNPYDLELKASNHEN